MATQSKYLTTREVQAAFGVGHMTVYNWRQGSATRDPLPTEVGDNKRVTFKLSDLKTWAKQYGFKPNFNAEAPAVRPGPKSVTKKVTAKKAPKLNKLTAKQLAAKVKKAKTPIPRPAEVSAQAAA